MKRLIPACLLLFACQTLFAQNIIRVEKSGDEASSVDFSAFAADSGQGRVFLDTLKRNLILSGYFKEGPSGSSEFRLLGDARGDGSQVRATIRVADVQRQRYGKQYNADAGKTRTLAQQVSDEILMALKNKKGFASTRLVLVGIPTGARAKELFMVDPDGGDLKQLTQDGSVVLGPKWTPDGKAIHYTSFHRGFPDVYRIDLAGGKREVLANYSGMNSGGALSPDGNTLALILSREGRPELYARGLRGGQPIRLTRTNMSPKSSPTWSPDGQRIAFVSGHGGIPHIYEVSRNGGALRRLSSGGSENLSPQWNANGWITFTRKQGRFYQVAILNPASGEMRVISPADADYEDPTWAPDGRHIAASRTAQRQSSLVLLDTGGNPPVTMLRDRGNWYMPHWSP
jgi:TolB protein